MKLVYLLLALLMITSCDSYQKPVCHSSNFSDIPDFEGDYLNGDSKDEIVSINHISKGKYFASMKGSSEDDLEFRTCRVSSNFYVEIEERDEEKSKVSFELFQIIPGPLEFTSKALSFDTEALDKAKIPYREFTEYSILVDNKNISETNLLKFFTKMNYYMTFVRL